MNRLTHPSMAPRRLSRIGLFLIAFAVPLIAVIVFFRGGGPKEAANASAAAAPAAAVTSSNSQQARNSAARANSDSTAAPGATEFAEEFVGATNQYAKEHGDAKRLGHAHCVVASPGYYMCSYTVEKPGAPSTCHLMQAHWTPRLASSITVTLSGRTRKCGSVREAINTLR